MLINAFIFINPVIFSDAEFINILADKYILANYFTLTVPSILIILFENYLLSFFVNSTITITSTKYNFKTIR